MEPLSQVGLAMIAIGALTGWAVHGGPSGVRRVTGVTVVQPRRVLQGHLELIIMGGLFVAAGSAVASVPLLVLLALVYGGAVAPGLFFVLAVRPDAEHSLVYRALDLSSLVALTAGWLALAVIGFALG